MPEIHLSVKKNEKVQRKSKEKIQKFKETGDSLYICSKKLDKARFQHDMAYGDFKNLSWRTASDKLLHDKGFNYAENLKYDGSQSGHAPMVYKVFDKKSFGANISRGAVKTKIKLKQQLAKELHKPIIRKFEKRKVNSSFIDNILDFDTTDMQLIGKL